MKRGLMMLLAISLLWGILPMEGFAVSNYDKEMEKVLIRVKEIMDIPDTYDTFDAQVNSNEEQVNFHFNWSDSKQKMDSISITSDEEGNILGFNKFSPKYKDAESKVPNITKEEALTMAEKFLQKVYPQAAAETRLVDRNLPINIHESEYSFSFVRIVNDIPYYDNTMTVNVNKLNKEVKYYYSNWNSKLKFPQPKGILDQVEGIRAYRDNIGLELIYKNSYRTFKVIGSGQDTNYFLTYSSIYNNSAIDAFTGKRINIGYYMPLMGMEKESADMAVGQSLTPEERGEIDKIAGVKNIDEIEPIGRRILEIDSSYRLQSSNLYADYRNPGEYQWNLYFIKSTDNKRNMNMSISLDAKTGDLISLYRYEDVEGKKTLTKDAAYDKAFEYLKTMHPHQLNQIEYIQEDYNNHGNEYSFTFIRKIDDTYVESDSININISGITGNVLSYNLNWYRGQLPEKGNIIGADRAYDILFNDIGYGLRYVTVYGDKEPYEREIKLAYMVNPEIPLIIDAHSGNILDYSGQPYRENQVLKYRDIEGSYAKDIIESLAAYGVGFKSDEFKPKNVIKQKDFMYLLFKSMNTYRIETESDMDRIYEELINTNIIKQSEKFPDRNMTKEEAVKFVIRAMNLEKVAELDQIYKDIFGDSDSIAPGLKGHINIAYGLEIIKGDGSGNINPKSELKREDAAGIIYRYMFN